MGTLMFGLCCCVFFVQLRSMGTLMFDFLPYTSKRHSPRVRATALRCFFDVRVATQSPFRAKDAPIATAYEDLTLDADAEVADSGE